MKRVKADGERAISRLVGLGHSRFAPKFDLALKSMGML
jgi:hypothetical protein